MSRQTKRRAEVAIWPLQDRRSSGATKPWVVRWRVGDSRFSRAFAAEPLALSFEAALRVAVVAFEYNLAPEQRANQNVRTAIAVNGLTRDGGA